MKGKENNSCPNKKKKKKGRQCRPDAAGPDQDAPERAASDHVQLGQGHRCAASVFFRLTQPKYRDAAFVDRADLKLYVPPPGPAAIYEILRSCVHELMRAGVIGPRHTLLDTQVVPHMLGMVNDTTRASVTLYQIATAAKVLGFAWQARGNSLVMVKQGLSGRALRKLPVLAHARFVQAASTDVDAYLRALKAAVAGEREAREPFACEP